MYRFLPLLGMSLLCAGSFSIISPAYSQSTLTPAAPPGDTMKTLEEVEPRTPLDPDTFLSISTPGSYYLTGDIERSSGNAIVIKSDDVTIDLNGFTLRGTHSFATRSAIWVSGDAPRIKNVVIKNGKFSGNWRASVSLSGVDNVVLEDLEIFGGGNAGLEDFADESELNSNVTIRNVNINGDGNLFEGGINLFMTQSFQISNVQIKNCSGPGINIDDPSSTVPPTSTSGMIRNTTVADCSAGIMVDEIDTGFKEHPVTVRDCVVMDCSGPGISVYGRVINCQALRNTDGIEATSVEGSLAEDNTSDGIIANYVKDCVSYSNDVDGIVARTVLDSTAAYNNMNGIFMRAGYGMIRNNVANGNGEAGIYVPSDQTVLFTRRYKAKIADNYVVNNGLVGIEVDTTFCFIVRNVAAGNGERDEDGNIPNLNSYDFAANNFYGEIVDLEGASAPAVNGNSAPSNLTTTDPWANFALDKPFILGDIF